MAIARKHDACPDMKAQKLAEWAKLEFNLIKAPDRSTISRILKRRNDFLQSDNRVKKKRVVKNSILDTALANWVLQMEQRKICLTGEIVKEKGRKLAIDLQLPPSQTPGFSNGWLESFYSRHGFKTHNLHGEAASVPVVNTEDLDKIKSKINEYGLRNVYNMDETGLFYCMAPSKTISQRQIEGSKKDKTRLTVAFTCNADGSDKLEPLFLGHSERPRCFNKRYGRDLGFNYFHNKKAWMTGQLFAEFLAQLDQHVGRKVLLFVDNAPSHKFDKLTPKNVEVCSLPPNTTSKLQPMDAGIIASVKRRYRARHLQHAVDMMDNPESTDPYKVDQLKAMRWIKAAWDNTTPATLANCWRHTGLLTVDEAPRELAEDCEEQQRFRDQIEALQETMGIQDPLDPDELVNVPEEGLTDVILSDEELLECARMEVDEEDTTDSQAVEAQAPVPDPIPLPSNEVILESLSRTISTLSDETPTVKLETAMQVLRVKQREIRRQLQEERAAALELYTTQTKISSFFT